MKHYRQHQLVSAQKRYRLQSKLGIALLNLGCLLLPSAIALKPAMAAEYIYASYGPLEVSIPISSLELYAKEGKIDQELSGYTKSLTPKQLEQFRQALVTRLRVTPVAVAQFFYSPIGETLLRRIGEVIQTKSRQPGFYAVRAAMIQAAADPEGLTLINAMRKFPTYGIRINSGRSFEIVEELTKLIAQTQVAVTAIEQQAISEASLQSPVDFSQLPDLRLSGGRSYQKETITLNDVKRDRTFPVDLYLPTSSSQGLTPLIVISHGLGNDRTTFTYLAKHLASYGFAVAVPEHPGSNSQQFQDLMRGLVKDVPPSTELINRPLDIKYLLDQLETSFKGRLNLQQVGVIGQSFGGYTAFALAGAKINEQQLIQDCSQLNDSLNLSLLLQCKALNLATAKYNLQDDRVKAIVVMNALNSSIFGKSELEQIKAPVMVISSSVDTVAPALIEQIQPFTWLTTPQKYLALLKNGTHFSTLEKSPDDINLAPSLIGPDPRIAYQYVKGLSLAFFQTYVAGNSEYQQYLSPTYAQAIARDAIPLILIQSLTEEQLKQSNNSNRSQSKLSDR